MLINVCGQDPSLRNWGIAKAVYDTETKKVTVSHITVIQPTLNKSKQIRQNSLDIDSADQLFKGAYQYAKDAQMVFAEVPVGSQSSRSMVSYALCIGILGSFRALNIPFVEVTPTEVKMATVGSKTATKEEMITWAVANHSEANWPTYKHKGKELISAGNAEHMADAIGAIYAGIASNSFQQTLKLFEKHHAI